MTKRVLVTDHAWPLDIEREVLAEVDAELLVAEQGEEDELIRLAREADAILTNWRKVPMAALDIAPRCLIVSRYGIGVDNIPVEHATRLGILVTNVPDFCIDEVSDHAMALVLCCARRIAQFDRATSSGVWDLAAVAPGMSRLRGQTLGLVGYGRLARAVAAKAIAFGLLSVLAFTPRLEPGEISVGVRGTNDLEQVVREADYLSLHAPATSETRNMINERMLRLMKPTAYLVNTSRGALVDEEALYLALGEKWIAGAALDVLALEPAPPEHPLLELENVVVTPHASFYSKEAIIDLARRAAQHVAQVFRGVVPPNVVNPEMLTEPSYRLGV